jgi:hypothetical protein
VHVIYCLEQKMVRKVKKKQCKMNESIYKTLSLRDWWVISRMSHFGEFQIQIMMLGQFFGKTIIQFLMLGIIV